MKQVYIHIGPPKTGSTTLQRLLSGAEQRLFENGVLYPSTGRLKGGGQFQIKRHEGLVRIKGPMESHQLLAWSINGKVTGLTADECWYPLIEELRRSTARSAVISAEDLANFELEHIYKFKSYLSGFDVKVIVYFRDPFGLAVSHYAQFVKMGRYHGSFESFIDEKLGAIRAFEPRFALWGSVFGKKNIIVKPYDKLRRNSELESDFLAIMGLTNDRFAVSRSGDFVNESPSPEEIKLIRLVNFLEKSYGAYQKRPSGKLIFPKIRKKILEKRPAWMVLAKVAGAVYRTPLYSAQDQVLVEELVKEWFPSLLKEYIPASDYPMYDIQAGAPSKIPDP